MLSTEWPTANFAQLTKSSLAYDHYGNASCNFRLEGKVFLYCLFVFSLSKKPTLLIIQTGCSLIADEITDAACGWRKALSDYSRASQSGFAWVCILGNHHVSVPYSACFIIVINISFCRHLCLWFKVVESTSMFWKQEGSWKHPQILQIQFAC